MSNGRYSLMGPAMLITVGTLFLIHEWLPDYHFGRLWPVILIVIGIVKLLEAGGAAGGSSAPGTPGNLPPGNPTGASGGATPPGTGAGTSGS
jgi:hypothetical protein